MKAPPTLPLLLLLLLLPLLLVLLLLSPLFGAQAVEDSDDANDDEVLARFQQVCA